MRGGQKSAEGIVAAAHGGEGPNMMDWESAEASMGETGADRRAEMPEDSPKVAGGTREGRERERQASTAVEGTTHPGTRQLIAEVTS